MSTNKLPDLAGVFYAPNVKAIMPYVIEVRKAIEFHYDDVNFVAMRIICLYYDQFKNDKSYEWFYSGGKFGGIVGDFNLSDFIKCVNKCLLCIRQTDFFRRPSHYGIYPNGLQTHKEYIVFEQGEISTKYKSDKVIFAEGVLTDIMKDADRDPYETAGGYRGYEAEINTSVFFALNADNSIYLIADFNCVVDHYNNNFFGVSTGGGTTTYKKGERVEVRTIETGLFELNEVLKKYPNISLKKMDCSKGISASTAHLEKLSEL